MSFAANLGSFLSSTQIQKTGRSLRDRIGEHTLELSTGRVQDPARHQSRDIVKLALTSSALQRNEVAQRTAAQAADTLSRMQTSLSNLTTLANQQRGVLVALAGGQGTEREFALTASQGASDLQQMISALSVSQAGRNLFSGAATDRAPLPDAATLLDSVIGTIPPGASAADVLLSVDSFFNTPGGPFETAIYAGSDGIQLSPTASGLSYSLPTATHPAIRASLRDTALIAMLHHPDLVMEPQERMELVSRIIDYQPDTVETLIGLRSEIGVWETGISGRQQTLLADQDMNERRRSELIGADPYLAATRLEEARTQLEALYLVTARIARLSLVEYLR